MKKDVYKYYMEQIDSYKNLKIQLDEISKVKSANQQAIDYIKGLVDTMEVNVTRLSYIMYLLKMPLFGKVRKAYEGKYSGLSTLFEKYKADEKSVKLENDEVMNSVLNFMNSLPDKEDEKKKKPSSNKSRAIKRKKKEEK